MADEVFVTEHLANGKIACYRFISTGAEASEAWFQEVVNLFNGWHSDEPLLLLIDLSKPDNQLSAEALKAGREASQTRPDVPGKTALLIDGDEPSQNVKALVEHVLAGTRERKIFSSEAEAVAWLLEE